MYVLFALADVDRLLSGDGGGDLVEPVQGGAVGVARLVEALVGATVDDAAVGVGVGGAAGVVVQVAQGEVEGGHRFDGGAPGLAEDQGVAFDLPHAQRRLPVVMGGAA